jgi:hypothetical protein
VGLYPFVFVEQGSTVAMTMTGLATMAKKVVNFILSWGSLFEIV